MNYENEITVKVLVTYDELTKILVNQGFKVIFETILDDIYMTNNDIKSTPIHELLHNYIIIRNSGTTGPMVTYKYKEFNENNSIKKQGKIELKVEDTEKSKLLFEKLGYKELIRIHNDVKKYEKDDISLVAAYVNNEYLCVEYSKPNEISIDKVIEEFKKYNIPYDDSNYFINKAMIEIEKKNTNNS